MHPHLRGLSDHLGLQVYSNVIQVLHFLKALALLLQVHQLLLEHQLLLIEVEPLPLNLGGSHVIDLNFKVLQQISFLQIAKLVKEILILYDLIEIIFFGRCKHVLDSLALQSFMGQILRDHMSVKLPLVD